MNREEDFEFSHSDVYVPPERSENPQAGADRTIAEIRALEESGVLGPEQCPEEHFWRWFVIKPDELPEKFRYCYEQWNEIRWYGGEIVG